MMDYSKFDQLTQPNSVVQAATATGQASGLLPAVVACLRLASQVILTPD